MTVDPDDVPEPEPLRSASRVTVRRVLVGSLLVLAAFAVALAVYVTSVVGSAPGVSALKEVQSARPSTLLTADGQPLGVFRREKQARVPLSDISPNVIHALIATEDHRFRDHHGVDVRRTVSALFHTVRGDLQGGSTLTQQLARNLFPEEIGRSRSLHRKLKEVVTALRIEQVYTKDEILEIYLNTVPFFYNVVGVEMAARTYFDTSARELDELQAATLVGMLKGTQYYNPVRHPERAEKRRNVVLGQMARHGYLTDERRKALVDRPLAVQLRHQPENDSIAPHFVAFVRKQLLDWADSRGYNLYADGLVIRSTIDSRLQAIANQAVARQGR
ncbi:MAG: transglycosylase domain-containing protein, partial [Rhizobacter sp.]